MNNTDNTIAKFWLGLGIFGGALALLTKGWVLLLPIAFILAFWAYFNHEGKKAKE